MPLDRERLVSEGREGGDEVCVVGPWSMLMMSVGCVEWVSDNLAGGAIRGIAVRGRAIACGRWHSSLLNDVGRGKRTNAVQIMLRGIICFVEGECEKFL